MPPWHVPLWITDPCTVTNHLNPQMLSGEEEKGMLSSFEGKCQLGGKHVRPHRKRERDEERKEGRKIKDASVRPRKRNVSLFFLWRSSSRPMALEGRRIKLLLAGPGGVGKTTYVNRLRTGEFNKRYEPTLGAEVNPLPMSTNQGHTVFSVWETAGQERYSGLNAGYAIGASAILVMFDLTSKVLYREALHDVRKLHTAHPNTPMLLCGDKVDCKDRRVSSKELSSALHSGILKKLNVPYYDLSVKSNYNFDLPLLHLLRELASDAALQFTEEQPLAVQPQTQPQAQPQA
jgi:GTP-binding nuclear protein Ran